MSSQPEKTIPDDSPSKSPSVASSKSDDKENPKGFKNDQGETYFKLGPKRRVTVRKWKNSQFIDIREYYVDKSGSEAPGKKGISLSMAQWKALKECIYDVDQLLESD